MKIGCYRFTEGYLEASGAFVGEHVGGIARNLAVDGPAKELVDEHNDLHSKLPGRYHHHQLGSLQCVYMSLSDQINAVGFLNKVVVGTHGNITLQALWRG